MKRGPARRRRMETVPRDTGFARIVRTPGTLGGEPRIDGTRIPVWVVVLAHREFEGDLARLRRSYPALDDTSISEALAFFAANRDEVVRNMIDNEADLCDEEFEVLPGRSDHLPG